MYIEPNSTIKILKGIPWDNTYQHTPRFKSRTEQTNYMNTKVAHTLNEYSYVREGRGWIKVQKNVEELIGCNYLMFQNPKANGTKGKTFYAFITATEYVNTETTEVRYEIDIMQTWFLDCKLGQCFIERSHSATDEIGDNTVTEDVSIGDYICTATKNITSGVQWKLCAITGGVWLNPSSTAGDRWEVNDIYAPNGGLPSVLNYNFFDLNSFASGALSVGQYVYTWNNDIKHLLDNHPDNLLALVIMPSFFHGSNNGDGVVGTTNAKFLDITVDNNTSRYFQAHGGSIKNKKMFTFPYCCLELTNNQGDTAQYKYEYFAKQSSGYTPVFRVMSDVTADASILVAPVSYQGRSLNLDQTIHLTDFPYIGHINDIYKNWLAMNKNQRNVAYDRSGYQQVMALFKGAIGAGSSAMSGKYGKSVEAGVQAIDNIYMVQYDIEAMLAKEADLIARGATPIGGKGSTLLFGNDSYNITAKEMSLKWEQAKRIDDYFTVYGYAMRCIGTPNITSRPHWNYIKLANPNITPINGGVPADDVGAIVRILANGITFWHNPSEIGNYSLDNSI